MPTFAQGLGYQGQVHLAQANALVSESVVHLRRAG